MDSEVLQLANSLLQHAGIPRVLRTSKQCNSVLFAQLYEALTGFRVPGLVAHAPTSESVKCQAVVDALSRQLPPHCSLEHIQGGDLSRREPTAVRNLLDIFSVLYHMPLTGEAGEMGDGNGGESEGEGEGREGGSEADDSNIISTEGLSVISEVILEELGPSPSAPSYSDSTASLLRSVPRARAPPLARAPRWGDSTTSADLSSSLPTNSSCDDRGHLATVGSRGRRLPALGLRARDSVLSSSTSSDPARGLRGAQQPGIQPVRAGVSVTVVDEVPATSGPPIVIPSGSSAEPSSSAPSHTPPSTPPPSHQHESLHPPLHHSTPHTNTRSRVFTEQPPHMAQAGRSGQEQRELQRSSKLAPPSSPSPPFLPPATRYYTELTHPPRLEAAAAPKEPLPRVPLGPSSAPEAARKREGERGVEVPDQSPELRPVMVSSAVQTEDTLLESSQASTSFGAGGGDQESTHLPRSSSEGSPAPDMEKSKEPTEHHPTPDSTLSLTPTPPPKSSAPQVHFSASTERGALHEPASASDSEEGGPSFEVAVGDVAAIHRKLELDGQVAQARADVLAALYQNYLREMEASEPRRARRPRQAAPVRDKPPSRQKRRARSNRSVPGPQHRGEDQHRGEEQLSDRPGSSESSDEERAEQKETPTKVAIGDDMLPLIEREFPHIHVSPATLRRLWQRQLQQIMALSKPQTHQLGSVKQVADMERRHKALLQAIRKELDHTRRMQSRREQQQQHREVQVAIQARRQATARTRRYYNDYELRLKAKLQRRKTREEQVFRRAFEEGLELQRERVRELRRYAKEKRQAEATRHQHSLESLDNYYRDQFAMLAESVAREREEIVVREKAQSQAVRRLRREVRQRLEREVQQLQDCLDREEDVVHFRELDAQGLRHKLNRLTFTTNIN